MSHILVDKGEYDSTTAHQCDNSTCCADLISPGPGELCSPCEKQRLGPRHTRPPQARRRSRCLLPGRLLTKIVLPAPIDKQARKTRPARPQPMTQKGIQLVCKLSHFRKRRPEMVEKVQSLAMYVGCQCKHGTQQGKMNCGDLCS